MGRFILKSVDWIFAKFCIYKESNMSLMQICVIKFRQNLLFYKSALAGVDFHQSKFTVQMPNSARVSKIEYHEVLKKNLPMLASNALVFKCIKVNVQ